MSLSTVECFPLSLRAALLPKLLSGELRLPSQGFGTADVPAANLIETHA